MAVDPYAARYLYSRPHWEEVRFWRGSAGSWAPYFIDWLDYVTWYERGHPEKTTRFGPLLLLRL